MTANNTINGRTPEEIKQWLNCESIQNACECEEHSTCASCPHFIVDDEGIPEATLAYIRQLEHSWDELFETAKQLERERDEARNDLDTNNYANTELHSAYEAMKRERDAAVELLHGFCGACANEGKHEICVECSRRLPFEPEDKNDYWQWRGVEVE